MVRKKSNNGVGSRLVSSLSCPMFPETLRGIWQVDCLLLQRRKPAAHRSPFSSKVPYIIYHFGESLWQHKDFWCPSLLPKELAEVTQHYRQIVWTTLHTEHAKKVFPHSTRLHLVPKCFRALHLRMMISAEEVNTLWSVLSRGVFHLET